MYRYRCRILRIVDGDTVDVDIDLGFNIWLNNRRVRLASIDAPETRTTDLVEKELGVRASKRLSEILPVGSICTVETLLDKNDGFGRILGTFYSNHSFQSVNKTMIQEGYANIFKR